MQGSISKPAFYLGKPGVDEHGGVSAVGSFSRLFVFLSDVSDIKRGRCRKTVCCGRSTKDRNFSSFSYVACGFLVVVDGVLLTYLPRNSWRREAWRSIFYSPFSIRIGLHMLNIVVL